MEQDTTPNEALPNERSIKTSMLRGLKLRCPNCGSGPMLRAYLKVRDHCPECGENLSHHRADDGPAYLTILLSGHIVAPLILFVYSEFRPSPAIMAITFSVIFATVALFLLPRFKGMIVGIQWAKRMHGFADMPAGQEACKRSE